jgi:hypothetical protein
MIFNTITYYDNDGNSIAIGDTVYPAQDFSMKVYQVNSPVKKTQSPGRFPSFSYPEFREINIAGEILGDSASDYNTKVRALKAVVNPARRTFATARRHGTLIMTFFGDATIYGAYVIVDQFETPKEALYPSVGPYTITWIAFEPYLQIAAPILPGLTTSYARNL